MNFLSGGKLKFVIFGLLFIMAIGFLAFQPDRSRYESKGILSVENSDKEIRIATLNQITKKDSDNDGLKDWEEKLWGTSPNNPDTDGDGTNDGDEVNAGRDPTLAGPNDELEDNILISSQQNYSADRNTELTTLDKFAQDIFTDYISMRESGAPLSEDDKSALVDAAVQNFPDSEITVQQYKVSDLTVSEDVSKEAVKNYGNILGEIILKHSFETENELIIFHRALTNEDSEEIKKLDPIIEGYKNILKDSLAVTVPNDAVKEHLLFVQSIALVATYIESMRDAYDDPIKAIAGIGGYMQGVSLLENAFQQMSSYFMIKGVEFSEYETGFVMANII